MSIISLHPNPVRGRKPTPQEKADMRQVLEVQSETETNNLLTDKADLDPESGRLVDEQLPEQIEAKILLRFGSRSELDNAEPPLEDNEPAYETDTGFYRLGATRYPNETFLQNTKADLVGGTVPDAQLASNIARLDAPWQNFAGEIHAPFLDTGYVKGGAELSVSFRLEPGLLKLEGNSGLGQGSYRSTRINLYNMADGARFDLQVTSESPEIHLSHGGDPNIVFTFPTAGGEFLTSNSTLAASKVDGVLNVANVPNLNASKINAGTFNVARIPTTIARVADEDTREQGVREDIEALRREIELRKQSAGGVFFDQAGGAEVPISINDLAQGGTQSFSLGWVGKTVPNTATSRNTLFGSAHGVQSNNPGTAGIMSHSSTGHLQGVAENTATTLSPLLSSGVNTRPDDVVAVLTFEATSGLASMYVNGELKVTADWSDAVLNSPHHLRIMQSVHSQNGIDVDRSPSGYTTSVAAWNKALSASEVAEWSVSGGQIMPLTARADCAVHLTMDEGIGIQLHDRSGNRNHALLTETGFEHIVPKQVGYVEVKVPDSIGDFEYLRLYNNRDVLPDRSYVTGVTSENMLLGHMPQIVGGFVVGYPSDVLNQLAVYSEYDNEALVYYHTLYRTMDDLAYITLTEPYEYGSAYWLQIYYQTSP